MNEAVTKPIAAREMVMATKGAKGTMQSVRVEAVNHLDMVMFEVFVDICNVREVILYHQSCSL